MHRRHPLLLALLLATACGGDADERPSTGNEALDRALARDEDAREAFFDRTGEATLTIGDRTWELDVSGCDLGGESDTDGANTLNATGTSEDGERMTLQVSRIDVGSMTNHEVTFYTGPMTPTTSMWDLSALSMGGRWTDANGGGALDGSPLVIDGTSLTAEGTFSRITVESEEVLEQAAGRLVATCED